jgi:ABC-type multidrug transport system ATPase subunit
MRGGGMTILVSTAYLDEGEKCDRLVLMHRSQVLATSTPAEIRGRFSTLEDAMIARIQEVDREIVHDSFKR